MSGGYAPVPTVSAGGPRKCLRAWHTLRTILTETWWPYRKIAVDRSAISQACAFVKVCVSPI